MHFWAQKLKISEENEPAACRGETDGEVGSSGSSGTASRTPGLDTDVNDGDCLITFDNGFVSRVGKVSVDMWACPKRAAQRKKTDIRPREFRVVSLKSFLERKWIIERI